MTRFVLLWIRILFLLLEYSSTSTDAFLCQQQRAHAFDTNTFTRRTNPTVGFSLTPSSFMKHESRSSNPLSERRRQHRQGNHEKTTTTKKGHHWHEKTQTSSSNERTVVLLYHKPPNVITSRVSQDDNSNTEDRRLTVFESILESTHNFKQQHDEHHEHHEDIFKRITGISSYDKLHAVGRLDADTTGLLLLTNDGGLVHYVTNPTANWEGIEEKPLLSKSYTARVMGRFDNDSPAMNQLREGVDIGKKYGGMTKPAMIEVLDDDSDTTTARKTTSLVNVTISEGRNRQVRRMFHAVQSGVIQLHRSQIGNLRLTSCHNDESNETNLEEGEWRVLTEQEVWDGLHFQSREIPPPASTTTNSSRRRNGPRSGSRKYGAARKKPTRRSGAGGKKSLQ